MIRIGQMARLFGITPRTLRHYAAIGLFSPASTNPENSYRLYHPKQMDELARILQLRHLEVPLDMIARLRNQGTLDNATAFTAFLLRHRDNLVEEISQRSRLLDEITHLITHIEKGNNMKPEIDVVTLPAFAVAGLKIDCLDASAIPALWTHLQQTLAGRGQMGRDWTAFGLCEPTDGEHFSYTAGIALQPDEATPPGLQRYTIPTRRYARFVHTGRIDALAETSRMIWRQLESGWHLEAGEGAELERYDARFCFRGGNQETVIEGFIPLKAH